LWAWGQGSILKLFQRKSKFVKHPLWAPFRTLYFLAHRQRSLGHWGYASALETIWFLFFYFILLRMEKQLTSDLLSFLSINCYLEIRKIRVSLSGNFLDLRDLCLSILQTFVLAFNMVSNLWRLSYQMFCYEILRSVIDLLYMHAFFNFLYSSF
jgi:hypothetical protein